LNTSGETPDIWSFGVTVHTAVFLTVHNKLLLSTKYHDIVNLAVYVVCSYWFYVFYLWMTDSWHTVVKQEFTFERLFASPIFWVTALLSTGVCFILDFLLLNI
jgi:hypothetical protein